MHPASIKNFYELKTLTLAGTNSIWVMHPCGHRGRHFAFFLIIVWSRYPLLCFQVRSLEEVEDICDMSHPLAVSTWADVTLLLLTGALNRLWRHVLCGFHHDKSSGFFFFCFFRVNDKRMMLTKALQEPYKRFCSGQILMLDKLSLLVIHDSWLFNGIFQLILLGSDRWKGGLWRTKCCVWKRMCNIPAEHLRKTCFNFS